MPIMPSLRDLPIRNKLALIVVSSSCLALLLSFFALIARYVATEPAKLSNHMSTLAKVVGANSSGALVFNDVASAQRTLAALAVEPSIRSARIFDVHDKLFASFSIAAASSLPSAEAPIATGGLPSRASRQSASELLFTADSLRIAQPILLDGEQIGTVVLDAGLRPMRLALLRDIGAIWLIILAAGMAALFLSSRLQKLVSEPILDLARAMRRVSVTEDYSQQLERAGKDEIGSLIDGFNEMLNQIRLRDEQLGRRRAQLEETQRIARLADWTWDIASGQLLLSREACHLLGAADSCGDGSFGTFLMHIHPGDRARVQSAYEIAAADGVPINVEHRVLHADGSIGYVHQRGELAAPTRIAGTLQDVSEQVHAEEMLRVAANALENTADAVMITDADHRVISVNRAFVAMTGYADDEIVGSTAHRLRSEHHDAEFYATLWQQVDQAGQWEGEVWGRRKNGEVYPQWITISQIRDASGQLSHYVSVSNDISQYKRYEASLEFLAHNDPLTGLPNRAMFERQVREALGRARKHGVSIGLMFVDLDRFKMINDTLGHAMGDRLLLAAAARLKECVREQDLVARQGGDEFTVLLDRLREPQDAASVAQKIVEALARPFLIEGHELSISGSVGVSCYPQDAADVESLFKNADAAMYRAKEQGKNGFRFHAPDAVKPLHAALVLTNELRHAIEREEFVVHYQPRIDLASNAHVGLEALVRWQHPDRGLVMPNEFIALAEETGMIEAIGESVLRTACTQLAAWQQAGLQPGRLAVNLSPRQFVQRDLPQRIACILQECALDPRALTVEITEGILIRDLEQTHRHLAELKAMGIGIAVDDFGTGYSSLAYLKRFPLDCLKIDQSFVRETPHDADDTAITKAIIALGRSLRLCVVAEGVETPEQALFLQANGCNEAQGYLFGKPLAADQVVQLLPRAGQAWVDEHRRDSATV